MHDKYEGLPFLKENIYDYLQTDDTVLYLNLFVLLYADDTIVLAESVNGLQLAINGMQQYCNEFKLNINANKSKIMVFSRGKIRNLPVIYFGRNVLEVVFEYVYLGVTLSYNGSFINAIKRMYNIANRAMFELLKKGRKLFLDTDVMLKLFDMTVLPILLYGAEVWGFRNLTLVERLHLKFCKMLLKVKKSTPTVMVYGELGRLPISVHVKSRLLNFWFNLASDTDSKKLSSILYRLMLKMSATLLLECKWLLFVERSLNELGLSNIWLDQGSIGNYVWFKSCIKQRLFDQGQQNWYASLFDSSKCLNYRMFKEILCFESYLNVLPTKLRNALIRFRCRNNKFPIELGSYLNIPRVERLCTLCNKNDLGDEFHYVLICPFYSAQRKHFLKRYFWHNASTIKMKHLLQSEGLDLINLCKFICAIFGSFNQNIL